MTRFVSTAWVARGAAEFEAGAALRIHAKAGLATRANPMHVYMLEGYEKLGDDYIAYLREAHILIHDASATMAEVAAEYVALNEITSPYDVRCFIRWMVIERLCPGERLIHFDLDLFFKPSLDDMDGILSQCEGTLGGSPCITITTPEWLRVYREMVGRLISDRPGLQAELAYGGTPFRQDIASDQDLTSALERRGGILPLSMKGLENWAIIVNPLWGPHAVGRPTVYREGDRFGKLPVLFWHIQNAFSSYLTRFALAQTFRHPGQQPDTSFRLGIPQFVLNPSAEEAAFFMLRTQANRMLQQYWRDETAFSMPHSGNQFELMHTRAWVANAFIVEGRFREVFSSDWWWDPEGFVPAEEKAPAAATVPARIEPAKATPPSSLPANVALMGDLGGNEVIVEPSDRHVDLVIELRGTGNSVIVRRDCALEGVLIAGEGGRIEIGVETEMLGVRIVAEEGSRCLVGARCRFSHDVRINASDGHEIFDVAKVARINGPRPIEIGDDVWIGDDVQIAKGCVIGAGSVVEAASLLDGDYPAKSIIAGTPAAVTRTGIRWTA